MDFRIWAVLSAIFAGVTAVLAKKGVADVPANTALLVRVAFVLIFSAMLAAGTQQFQFTKLTASNWLFLGLSAVATWLSWLCYFRALQLGEVSKVAPIDKLSFVVAVALGAFVLHEKFEIKTLIGCALIVAGVWVTLQ